MSIRFGAIGAVLLLFGVYCSATPPDKGGPEKNTIKALFDGIPTDLRSKVRENPVRCDRVNDWLKENVNGKGKAIEIRLEVIEVSTQRSPKDGTYLVRLDLETAKVNVLEDVWQVYFSDHDPSKGRARYNFSFEGVSTAEAEKMVELKQVVIQGKVQEAKLSRAASGFTGPGVGAMTIALEDVRVDGKKWTPYIGPVGKNKGGSSVEPPKKGKGQQAP